jgi:hypothetical protein
MKEVFLYVPQLNGYVRFGEIPLTEAQEMFAQRQGDSREWKLFELDVSGEVPRDMPLIPQFLCGQFTPLLLYDAVRSGDWTTVRRMFHQHKSEMDALSALKPAVESLRDRLVAPTN